MTNWTEWCGGRTQADLFVVNARPYPRVCAFSARFRLCMTDIPDPRDFQPTKAIVTGGSSGIGQATAIALAQAGMDVAITYHSDEEGAKATERAVEKAGRKCFVEQADLSDVPEGAYVMERMIRSLAGCHVCVANAGGGIPYDPDEIDWNDWRTTIALNLDAPVLCLQLAARDMIERKEGGRLIAVTSVHDAIPLPSSMAYTAAKHGLRGAVATMALKLGQAHGITANCVAPGEIATAINDQSGGDAVRGSLPRPAIPAARPGHADEVARVIAFLASAQSSFVTGASWKVDGGLTAAGALAAHMHREKWLEETGQTETFET